MMLFLLSCFSLLNIKIIEKSVFRLDTPQSFGSGNFISLKRKDYAITAYHNLQEQIRINSPRGDEIKIQDVVFVDYVRDIAIFKINKISNTVSYKPHKRLREGLKVHYWCSAGERSNKYYKGYISKVYIDKVIVQGYAWMGCSGGLVFDEDNGLIGLVSALSLRNTNDGQKVVLENEIYVSLIREEDFYGG